MWIYGVLECLGFFKRGMCRRCTDKLGDYVAMMTYVYEVTLSTNNNPHRKKTQTIKK